MWRAMGVPRVSPSKTPLMIWTESASLRWVVMRLWPGARRSSSGWMSAGERGRRGGQPSTTAPMAGPWDSPQVVTVNVWPKVLAIAGCQGTLRSPGPPSWLFAALARCARSGPEPRLSLRQCGAGGVHHDVDGGGVVGPAFEGGGALVDEHGEAF